MQASVLYFAQNQPNPEQGKNTYFTLLIQSFLCWFKGSVNAAGSLTVAIYKRFQTSFVLTFSKVVQAKTLSAQTKIYTNIGPIILEVKTYET